MKPELDIQNNVPSKITKVIVAVGPFTTNENLLYEPLDDLLKVTKKEEPNLLLLVNDYSSF